MKISLLEIGALVTFELIRSRVHPEDVSRLGRQIALLGKRM
jgi:hypothetical protein